MRYKVLTPFENKAAKLQLNRESTNASFREIETSGDRNQSRTAIRKKFAVIGW
jgi:hypothetical protein